MIRPRLRPQCHPRAGGRQAILTLVLGALLLTPAAAPGATSLWLSDLAAGPADWSNVGLWDLPPTTGNNVVINNGISFPAFVTLTTDATIGQFTIGPGATLALANGKKLTFSGDSLLSGTLSLGATSTNTELIVNGALTLSGSGLLSLSNNTGNRIRGASASDTLTNQTTIEGSGAVGANALVIVNQGVISANGSVPLVVDPSSGGLQNTGILRATAGATLQLANGAFTNTGGTIEAQNASLVQIDAADIFGGSLSTAGSGRIDVVGSSLFQDVRIALGSALKLLNGVTLTLSSSLTNEGTLNLAALGNDTDLKISGPVTVSGEGIITLTDSDRNRIYADGTGTLTLGPNQVLQGAGKLGRNNLVIDNQGTIIALGTNVLEIDNDATTLTNQGTLKAVGAGGILVKDSSMVNLGTIEVTSLLTANGSFVQNGGSSAMRLLGGNVSAASFTFNDGSLSGSGTVSGPASATGTTDILPGGSAAAGTLIFDSTITMGSGVTVYFDLGGTTAGVGYDQIVGTTINLNGNLTVAFSNSFESAISPTDSFTLINTSTALNGTFLNVSNGSRFTTADGFGSFQANYSGSSLILSNFQVVPEPSTWSLLALGAASSGGLHLLLRRQRLRRRK